jgi:predicted GIY-YIG superfamily endonuclease
VSLPNFPSASSGNGWFAQGTEPLVELAETSVPFGKLSYHSGNGWFAQGTGPLVELAETSAPLAELAVQPAKTRGINMPYMYILECFDGSYYTGSTWNLEKRLWEHQNGLGANHTKKRLPVKLVYCEYYDRIEDAFRREKQIQGWSRRKKQALMEGNEEKLIEYSKSHS